VRPGLDRVSAELCGNHIILAGEIRAKEGGGDPVGPRDRGRRSRRRSVSESQLWRSGGTLGQKVRRASLGPSLLMVSCKVRQGLLVHVWERDCLIGRFGWRNGDCSGS
jgi:hypothetical protein